MSKNALVPIALTSLAALSSAALAASQTKTGEIKSTDAAKHEIVLSTGDTFEAGGKIKLDKLKVGEKVAITYEVKDGKMLASKIHATK